MVPQKTSSTKFFTYVLVFTLLVFTISLAAILLIGTTSRYMQDDYCYAAILRGNFLKQQINAYLHETTFSGNRFSLTLFTGISELLGPKFIAVLPGTMILLWLAGMYLFLRQIPLLKERSWPNRLEALILGEALVLFTMGMATNWVQVYFWRAGMFPYLAPLVFGTWLMFLLSRSLQIARTRWAWCVGIFLLTFLTGGFSEIAVTVEVSILAVCIIVILIAKNIKNKNTIPFVVALAGSLIALVLVIFSPMNLVRLKTSYGHSTSLITTLIDSLKGGVTFYVTTFYRQTLEYLSSLLLFAFLGWGITIRNTERSLPIKITTLWMVGAIVAAFLVTVVAMVPGFFAESSYPSDRALLVPRFVSLLLAIVLGLLAGNTLAGLKNRTFSSIVRLLFGISAIFVDVLWIVDTQIQFHSPAFPEMRTYLHGHPWVGVGTLVLSGMIFGYLLFVKRSKRVIPLMIVLLAVPAALIGARFFTEYPLMQARAVLWDGREAQILKLKAAGRTDLVVPAMNSLSGILELSNYDGFWVNHCAAAYYGVNSISAVEPVLDPLQLSAP
jgi:hypothetical protein